MADTAEVISQIASMDDGEISQVIEALQRRCQVLADERTRSVRVGQTVILRDLAPACLNGLQGQVEEYSAETGMVSVMLDVESTGALRFSTGREYPIRDEANYFLEGVPASCCFSAEESMNLLVPA